MTVSVPVPPKGSSDEVESPFGVIGQFESEAAPIRPANPVVMMEVSRDGGNLWTAAVSRPLGPIGKYGQLVRWFRQGSGRNTVIRFTISDAVPITVLDQKILVA